MYGDTATGLIRQFNGELENKIIPEYQYELLEQITKENDELYAENVKSSQSENVDENEIMIMQARHTAKLWNKRCVIAYHFERLNKLKQLRWEYGNNLPVEIAKNLSRDELEWFTKYNDNLFNYMNSLNNGEGLDITLHRHPPKKLYIKVKCTRDYGQFETEYGLVTLTEGNLYYLPLDSCEKLIHQGVLEQQTL